MALTALSLTPTKYAWVVRPVELEEVSEEEGRGREGRGGRREGEGGGGGGMLFPQGSCQS